MLSAHSRRQVLVPLAFLTFGAMLVFSGCAPDGPAPSASATAGPQGSAAADEEIFTPLVGSVLAPPLVVAGTDGLDHVAYELFLTNTIGQAVTIDGLSVVGDGAELSKLEGDELLSWIRILGSPDPGRVLVPGQSATVILDVAMAEGVTVPPQLEHVIEFSPAEAMPPMITAHMTQTIIDVGVDESEPIVIGSPVSGAGWLDGNGCCEASAHRSAINPVNGALHAPERFAIDFVQLDEESRIFDGPIDDLQSYAFYGAEILAVGDGPIVSMKWDLPDEKPGAHPVGLELGEYGGNHVVQKIGEGQYAFYAHLQGANPKKLAVGQEMSRGDVLGYLGNSGNTDMPHLHFHVMDSPLPLASNGLPFVFDSLTLAGTVGDQDLDVCMTEPRPCTIGGPGPVGLKSVMPIQQDVIDLAG
ncbi:M23 family metallopeptidase [Microbacterium pseudoresistens]|uniref:M23ase beta-sheet core domain-containing protein n=1 Tax=Microbacterium pseudoresistens TaxID=640634 RepID=A0A7Y9EWP6_9MICO|nr:M23 family metallopeptidase [Microbacterium pseudoresistens]NYD55234.1 hypothetical protein [Microbacterium pseudoresistens]